MATIPTKSIRAPPKAMRGLISFGDGALTAGCVLIEVRLTAVTASCAIGGSNGGGGNGGNDGGGGKGRGDGLMACSNDGGNGAGGGIGGGDDGGVGGGLLLCRCSMHGSSLHFTSKWLIVT